MFKRTIVGKDGDPPRTAPTALKPFTGIKSSTLMRNLTALAVITRPSKHLRAGVQPPKAKLGKSLSKLHVIKNQFPIKNVVENTDTARRYWRSDPVLRALSLRLPSADSQHGGDLHEIEHDWPAINEAEDPGDIM